MTGKERLLRALNVMERVRDHNLLFNINNWFDNDYEKDVLDCGSSACFAGWCCRDEVLSKEGLTINFRLPAFGIMVSYEALAVFFDIPLSKTYWIANPFQYPGDIVITPDMVINRIRAVLQGYGDYHNYVVHEDD